MTEEPKRTKSALYEHLKQEILTMRLAPGADLDEGRLSSGFSLSRTPLREVLRRLAGEGYVILRENRGARVADLGFETLRDFFVAAPMIYGAVLRLAARHARPDQVNMLRAAQKAFRAALRTGGSCDRSLANNRFHEITGEMAGNVYLLPSFHRLLIDHARVGTTFYMPTTDRDVASLDAAAAQHDEMIEAIADHDEDRAEALAHAHWTLSRGQIEKFVMPDALELPLGRLFCDTSA